MFNSQTTITNLHNHTQSRVTCHLRSLFTHKIQYYRSQWHHLEKPISRLFIDLPLHKNLSTPHSIQFQPNYIIHWEKKWTSESVKHVVRRNQSRPNWLWHVIVHASSEEPEGTWEVSRGQIRANNFRLLDVHWHGKKLEIFNERRGTEMPSMTLCEECEQRELWLQDKGTDSECPVCTPATTSFPQHLWKKPSGFHYLFHTSSLSFPVSLPVL